MPTCVILIPIYKSIPDHNEFVSFSQCLRVLFNHPMCIVTYNDLNIEYYSKLLIESKIVFSVEYFDRFFFKSLSGYNRLLLSQSFYSRFKQFDFMLIHQLDAYVFRDELLEWCGKEYDFIGAPLIGHYTDTTFSNNFVVGNGGFSLRKTNTFINAFELKTNLLSAKEIINRYEVFIKPWARIPLLILMLFGFRNTLYYFARNWEYNEDDFWCQFLYNTNYLILKPSPEQVLKFAFERFPSNLFEITNELPFGCHGWEKYEYETFWKAYIPVD